MERQHYKTNQMTWFQCPHQNLATHWAHNEDWSDWVDAWADLSLCWAHRLFVGFVMLWLKNKGDINYWIMNRIWSGFCFTAFQHILRHFGCGQLPLPHCSWASLLGSLPVLSAHSFASNWQLLFLNQRKRENGRQNVFMTKSPRKNVPDMGIELAPARATMTSLKNMRNRSWNILACLHIMWQFIVNI